eukprot:1192058-Prorocentrum_minimum.AAC.1
MNVPQGEPTSFTARRRDGVFHIIQSMQVSRTSGNSTPVADSFSAACEQQMHPHRNRFHCSFTAAMRTNLSSTSPRQRGHSYQFLRKWSAGRQIG